MKKRISLEIIRIIAICMVIFNHTGENGFEMFRTAYGTPLWYFVILLDIVSKAGVPLFFIVSGYYCVVNDENCLAKISFGISPTIQAERQIRPS